VWFCSLLLSCCDHVRVSRVEALQLVLMLT
jgi:hypothetical protein